jgi:L-aspartate oxidase
LTSLYFLSNKNHHLILKKADVLIIGSGVAGLSLAINLAKKRADLSIHIITKTSKEESNTAYAQGGIASVWDFETDNFEKHIADTLDAGDGICDEPIVDIVVKEGPQRVKEIIDWGTRFDLNNEGEYDLGKEGGHSENRILHYKDITGKEIQRALNDESKLYKNIFFHEQLFAIDIITQHHKGRNVTRLTPDTECYGAYVFNKQTHDIETWLAKATIIASGGGGQVYKSTTNPTIATGDGIAMFYRAKGRVANMEFVQFHPTSLYNPTGENPSFLVSEAVRGFGATLRTVSGQEFMHKYDERLSLAPRDIVARAIDNEMKVNGDEYEFLDCTHLDQAAFYDHFPNITDKCKSIGIDPAKDYIPVVPACHYICGGILTDKNGKTSISRLYAAGECTNTGLHGANRLASNSLLEGLVFGYRIHEDLLLNIDQYAFETEIPDWNAAGTTEPKEMVLITQTLKELKEIMSSYVGIVRTDVRLKRAIDRLHLLYSETEILYNTTTLSPQLCELRNLITIAYLITKAAQMRKESRGLHYNTDHPNQFGYKETTLL